MKYQIENFVIEIRKKEDLRAGELIKYYEFLGDGTGDFVDYSSDASISALEEYYEYLKDQMAKTIDALSERDKLHPLVQEGEVSNE